jgi:hypothetical protein
MRYVFFYVVGGNYAYVGWEANETGLVERAVKMKDYRKKLAFLNSDEFLKRFNRQGKKVQMKIETEIKLRDRERHRMTNVTKK